MSMWPVTLLSPLALYGVLLIEPHPLIEPDHIQFTTLGICQRHNEVLELTTVLNYSNQAQLQSTNWNTMKPLNIIPQNHCQLDVTE